MYGFSGYGTNEYATSRFTGISGPIIRVANTVLRLLFKNTTLQL
jgi:hypothetical protein